MPVGLLNDRAVRYVLALTALALSACSACEKGGTQVDGPRPFVRCMEVDAPEARTG